MPAANSTLNIFSQVFKQILKHEKKLLIYFQSKMETVFIKTEEDNDNNLLPEETSFIEPVKSER